MRSLLIVFLKFLYYAIAFIRSVSTIPAILCMAIPAVFDNIFLKWLKFYIRILIIGKRKRKKLLQKIKRRQALDRLEKRKKGQAEEKKKAKRAASEKVGLLLQGVELMFKEKESGGRK